jgi:predicted O-methyltransferase YrrM
MNLQESLDSLAAFLEVPLEHLKSYWRDLEVEKKFLDELNRSISGVKEFEGTYFHKPGDLRALRCLLYICVRAIRPNIMIETGVLNGFSSAFALLAMHHNQHGSLVSIDLPPVEERIINQGSAPLPGSKSPGWAVPSYLRDRWTLRLARSEVVLPKLFQEKHSEVDIFFHDSDHSYNHMMFEMGLAWKYRKPNGLIIVDNIEANSSFDDFARLVQGEKLELYSFRSPERTWKHGLLRGKRDVPTE